MIFIFQIIRKYWLNLLFLFLLGACGVTFYEEKDLAFANYEKSFISAFKVNDTIFYESTKKDLDTILITNIGSSRQIYDGIFLAGKAFNRIWVEIKYLPVPANRERLDSSQYVRGMVSPQDLITISKHPKDKSINFLIEFRDKRYYSKYLFKHTHQDTLIINGIKISNYYKFKTKGFNFTDIEYFYWTIEKGLAAYECKDGTFWVRKN